MKCLLLLLFLPLFSYSQERATTESGRKVILNKNGTWKYAPGETKPAGSFSKETSGDEYLIKDSIDVNNGKDGKVKVFFSASVNRSAWDSMVNSIDGMTDKQYFSNIASLLAIDAKYSLKNNLSFEPFTKQFFTFYNNQFICDFKMSGRNGYGNMAETSTLVKYNPNK